jgi:hypothetical protein
MRDTPRKHDDHLSRLKVDAFRFLARRKHHQSRRRFCRSGVGQHEKYVQGEDVGVDVRVDALAFFVVVEETGDSRWPNITGMRADEFPKFLRHGEPIRDWRPAAQKVFVETARRRTKQPGLLLQT